MRTFEVGNPVFFPWVRIINYGQSDTCVYCIHICKYMLHLALILWITQRSPLNPASKRSSRVESIPIWVVFVVSLFVSIRFRSFKSSVTPIAVRTPSCVGSRYGLTVPFGSTVPHGDATFEQQLMRRQFVDYHFCCPKDVYIHSVHLFRYCRVLQLIHSCDYSCSWLLLLLSLSKSTDSLSPHVTQCSLLKFRHQIYSINFYIKFTASNGPRSPLQPTVGPRGAGTVGG